MTKGYFIGTTAVRKINTEVQPKTSGRIQDKI